MNIERTFINQLSAAELDVLRERRRQVSREGYTPGHDDEHADGSLAGAAAVYALFAELEANPELDGFISASEIRKLWPWSADSLKPRAGRMNLVRAGALIIAEIERLDRKAARR